MKIFKIILISLISLAFLASAVFFLVGYFKQKPGGIKITTDPAASIYINGTFVGKSPYEGTFKAESINLRLVPDTIDSNLIPFETNLSLVPGIQTVVGREFGKDEDESSDYVISFEKTGGEDAGFTITTRPDNAQILIDGVSRGFAPYKISAIAPAMHKITIKAPGYTDSEITVKTLVGYRLMFFAKLEKQSTSSATLKTFVKIAATPTGFLRVRTKPGAAGEQIAEVKPGEIYPFISDDAETGWLEIQYQEPKTGLPSGITGWISGDYAKKVDLPADSTTSANIK